MWLFSSLFKKKYQYFGSYLQSSLMRQAKHYKKKENLESALLSKMYWSLYTVQWKMQPDRKSVEINLTWEK